MKKSAGVKFATKKNNYPENGLTCCYCQYVTHKKCAIYKAANKFICSECQSDMFQKYEGISGTTKNVGCGFYLKETIPYFLCDDLSKKHKSQESKFGTFWLEIVGSANKNIVAGVTYRHTSRKQTQFPKYFKNTLNKIEKENKKTILISEFNINLLNFDSNNELHSFLDLLTNKWFIPQILNPTRVSEQTKPSLIDNIFMNFTDLHCYSGNLLEKISDHLSNFLIAEKLILNIKQQQKPTIRDFAKFDS